jgi:feruloyl esterase
MKTTGMWRRQPLAMTIAAACAAGGALVSTHANAATCESLASLSLPNTTITAAQTLQAGAQTITGTTAPGSTTVLGSFNGTLPVAICRVRGTVIPATGSNVIFEVWMPLTGWNGKFNTVGNGGTAGNLGLNGLVTPVGRGYAAVSTDTGHQGGDSSFAMISPERVDDFAHQGYHLATVAGKQVTAAFYGEAPTYAYFTGCSTGGAEALSEAQRFPADFNGIVAGAPANHYTLMWPGEVYPGWAARADPAGLITKLPALNKAALAACDAVDGVSDGIIDDPRKCSFDPATIQCSGTADNASCLTSAQVAVVRKIYAGLKDANTGAQIWPPYLIGSEDQWGGHINPGNPAATNPPINYFRYFVYDNPSFYYTDAGFNMDGIATAYDILSADRLWAPLLDSVDPNLQPFASRGGKLIMYHGWKDQNISPLNSVNYYNDVVTTTGTNAGLTAYKDALKKTQTFARLFMVPGMQHCNGGPGPNTFDTLTALENWVEKGIAPDKIIATHSTSGVVDISRPLCPYPQASHWNGNGSSNDDRFFSCVDPQ